MINAFIATRKTDFQVGTALIYLFGMSTNGTGEISGQQINSFESSIFSLFFQSNSQKINSLFPIKTKGFLVCLL